MINNKFKKVPVYTTGGSKMNNSVSNISSKSQKILNLFPLHLKNSSLFFQNREEYFNSYMSNMRRPEYYNEFDMPILLCFSDRGLI